MSLWNGQLIVAMGRWAGASSASTKGCTLTQGSGSGNYLCTLEQGLGANECIVLITPETKGASPSYAHTSNTVKTLTMGDPANVQNAANANFNIVVMQLPGT